MADSSSKLELMNVLITGIALPAVNPSGAEEFLCEKYFREN